MNEQIAKIREERRKYNISQKELAIAIGHKPNNVYISMLERGKIAVSPEQIGRILAAIEIIRQRNQIAA